MSENQKLNLLRQILAVKVAMTLFVWGFPAIFAPMSLIQILGIPIPDDPLFLRLFGTVVIAFGIAYWYAYKDPVHNVAILKAGIVDNGLATLVIFLFTVLYDLKSIFMWISASLTFIFFISFIFLIPKSETV